MVIIGPLHFIRGISVIRGSLAPPATQATFVLGTIVGVAVNENIIHLIMIQLEKSVRVAALPADRQFESFPPGLDVPYEIADDFGNQCLWVRNSTDVVLT